MCHCQFTIRCQYLSMRLIMIAAYGWLWSLQAVHLCKSHRHYDKSMTSKYHGREYDYWDLLKQSLIPLEGAAIIYRGSIVDFKVKVWFTSMLVGCELKRYTWLVSLFGFWVCSKLRLKILTRVTFCCWPMTVRVYLILWQPYHCLAAGPSIWKIWSDLRPLCHIALWLSTISGKIINSGSFL